MVYFFFKAEKSNSLVLTDCVNVFVYVFRLAGILNLGKNASESSIKRIFLFFCVIGFPYLKSPVIVGLENIQSWVPQALF